MSDKAAVLLTMGVAVAFVVFAVTVLDRSWPVALLIAGSSTVPHLLARAFKSRQLDRLSSDRREED